MFSGDLKGGVSGDAGGGGVEGPGSADGSTLLGSRGHNPASRQPDTILDDVNAIWLAFQ